MAITSTLVGSLGAGKVTTVPFTFSKPRNQAQDIDCAWDIPPGRHLLFWEGVKEKYTYATIIVDGRSHKLDAGAEDFTGYIYVDGPRTITATGEGSGTFPSLPVANWVKITS